jgi:hypothetical protein
MDDIFDPILFLGLNDLNINQINKLRPEIQKDIITYLINSFLSELDESEVIQLNNSLPSDHDFSKTMTLINQLRPSFSNDKEKYLENYRQQFKLQDFITYLT